MKDHDPRDVTGNDDSAEFVSSEIKNKSLKVPYKAFEDYLERMRPGRACVFCASGTYQAAPAPTGGSAGVVATPIPNIPKVGAWFYVATCDTCGDTRFFHSGRTYAAMTGDH